jgi:lysozyme
MNMRINQKGINLIKSFEGFSARPYICPAGVPTIGYGTTYYPNGKKVTIKDKPISDIEGETLLKANLATYEDAVDSFTTNAVNSNQFSALVSFAYNLGNAALKSSTLLKKVNLNPNDPGIRNEFMKWIYARGKLLKGLEKRRNEEADLYFMK